jgi:hypothetical protein
MTDLQLKQPREGDRVAYKSDIDGLREYVAGSERRLDEKIDGLAHRLDEQIDNVATRSSTCDLTHSQSKFRSSPGSAVE